MTSYPCANEVDIILISEGAYPFVSGGVSAWMQTLIKELSHLRFSVVFLGSRAEDYKKFHYDFPNNIIDFRIQYLFTPPSPSSGQVSQNISKHNLEQLTTLHDWFKNPDKKKYHEILNQIIKLFDPLDGLTPEQFHHSEASWEFICEHYEKFCSEPSFIDYFWTVKNMHAPLWNVAKLVYELPKAKIIHTVATGYAGLLGSLIKSHQNIPLILTEHGIYTKERRIELLQSDIVKHENRLTQIESIGYLRDLWINYFMSLAQICYEMSDDIIALYAVTSSKQREYGADAAKQLIIPNGIDIEQLKQYRHPFHQEKQIICLLGRIVPIKDIKTFIRSIKFLLNKTHSIEVWIVGPNDEDPDYAEECQRLIETMDLGNIIHMTGKMSLKDLLPKIDLLVLSSISEGMPLVVLEAFAAGIPVISTNVGSCEELICGLSPEDAALGSAGAIVKIASPSELADAIFSLLDEEKWVSASNIAIKRVEKLYSLNFMIDAYQRLYSSYLAGN